MVKRFVAVVKKATTKLRSWFNKSFNNTLEADLKILAEITEGLINRGVHLKELLDAQDGHIKDLLLKNHSLANELNTLMVKHQAQHNNMENMKKAPRKHLTLQSHPPRPLPPKHC